MKYLGQERYPYRQAGEKRVIHKIAPDRVQTMGCEPGGDVEAGVDA